MSDCDYRIYPSLLDKFQELLDYEQAAEQPWNLVSDAAHKRGEYLDLEVGDYILTPDEMAMKIEVELIDSINRCDYGVPMPAADRGTALNEIVDCMIMGVKSTRDDVKLDRARDKEGNLIGVTATIRGLTFMFDIGLCRALRDYFAGAVCQYKCEAEIETRRGNVLLYGYIDYWLRDRVLDLKTTSYYNFGKYERKWQRFVYPYCLVESGDIAAISEFEYTAVKLSGNKILTGDIYPEVYTYRHDVATDELEFICRQFIEWLQSVSPAITDKRIYCQENDEGSFGVPLAERLDLFDYPHLSELCDFAYKHGMYNQQD